MVQQLPLQPIYSGILNLAVALVLQEKELTELSTEDVHQVSGSIPLYHQQKLAELLAELFGVFAIQNYVIQLNAQLLQQQQ